MLNSDAIFNIGLNIISRIGITAELRASISASDKTVTHLCQDSFMSVSSRLANYRKHNPLAIKLLAAIILCSSVITVLATSAQLYSDYRYERSAIDQRIQQIESTSLASIENSLWEISPAQIQLQLEGLNQISDVQYITLDTPFN